MSLGGRGNATAMLGHFGRKTKRFQLALTLDRHGYILSNILHKRLGEIQYNTVKLSPTD